MKRKDPIITIYNKHSVVTVAIVLTASIIIGLLAIIPFYNNLKNTSIKEFNRFGLSVHNSVQSYIKEISNIALQVTSRTKARNTLIDFNNKIIDINSANKIISDILTDVLRNSKIVLGVTRVSLGGEVISSVGMTVPEDILNKNQLSQSNISFYQRKADGECPLIIVYAPINDRDNTVVGYDVVLFKLERIKNIIRDSAAIFNGSKIELIYKKKSWDEPIFTSTNSTFDSKDYLVQKYGIKGTDLYLNVFIQNQKLFETPRIELIRMLSLLFILLLFCFGIIFLLQHKFKKHIQREIMLRENREKEVLDLKIRFETVMDSLDALVYVSDLDTYELIYLNKYGIDNWGKPEGRKCYNLFQKNLDIPCNFCTNSKIIDENKNPKDVYVWEVKNSKDGNWYQCRDQAVLWPDGRIVRLEIATNITDLKNLESQLSDLTENLKAEVEREVAARQKQEQLLIQQSKMALMGEMIGVIAHQLKQPLNTMYLCAYEITFPEEGKNKKEHYEIIQNNIIDQVNYMDETINNFRNFFKPSTEKVLFSVCDMTKDVYSLVCGKFKSLDVQFLINDHDCFEIFGLQNELKQVLLNIFSNSFDVFEEREIKNRRIELDFEKLEDFAVIRIRDNGGGIPEHLLPDGLFMQYISTKGDRGTGIGLQISKVIVEEKFNGKIWARNFENGAEFTIELPMTKIEN